MTVSTYPDTLLVDAMCGDTSAVEFVSALANVMHFWDDLIDKDKVLRDEDINRAMELALLTLPTNQFYQQHFWVLHPILRNAITNWHIATRIERSNDESTYPIAFILRSAAVDIITACATIIGGREHGIRVGHEVHLYTHREGMDGYLNNLTVEKAVRECQE